MAARGWDWLIVDALFGCRYELHTTGVLLVTLRHMNLMQTTVLGPVERSYECSAGRFCSTVASLRLLCSIAAFLLVCAW